jgi:AbrB family looped-hinge helix DNA binding protein
MTASRGPTTTVSTKGRVILPKSIRQRRRQWGPGTRLTVEDTPNGLLRRSAALFAPARSEDVFGCLAYSGPAKTLEEMDAAVAAEARRRHARNRY